MASSQSENKASVVEIGQRLRQTREKRGLTIDQAQKQTHIHSTVLTAIEEGKCDDILTPNYVKSFLREYSTYLGFDHNAIVGEYLAIHPELKTRGVSFNAGKSDHRAPAELSNVIRGIRSALIFFALMSLAVFLSVKAVQYVKNIRGPGTAQPVKTAKADIKSKSAQASARIAPGSKAPSAKNVPFTMVIRVKNPVMVQLKKDGEILFKRVLPKGSDETFSITSRANIFVGRAESIEIIVDGRSFGSPGRGVMRDIEVTSTGIRYK